ncbi:MAG TPA: GNAT family N-acetyltransferase [Methylomirabilota bacterium]|jgi:ribosomal protein S18 acetylase RimI-like enzyme
MIRLFRDSDREQLKTITAEVFGPAAVDYYLERRFGQLQGRDWAWRKTRHIDDDIRTNAGGIFVYENGGPAHDGKVVGYITVTVDRDAGIGRIPNLAVAGEAQGRGVGRALVEHALEYLRTEGMLLARVETLEGNAAGEHLYPALGFQRVIRQIYYATRLRKEPPAGPRLYVVAREHQALFAQLQRDLGRMPEVEVVLDRRHGERRQRPAPASHERRVADRRLVRVEEDLARFGRAVVER